MKSFYEAKFLELKIQVEKVLDQRVKIEIEMRERMEQTIESCRLEMRRFREEMEDCKKELAEIYTSRIEYLEAQLRLR
jgi:hypothetical protein